MGQVLSLHIAGGAGTPGTRQGRATDLRAPKLDGWIPEEGKPSPFSRLVRGADIVAGH